MTKVVFFGNERLVSGLERTDTPILKGLIERGYDVVAVVSHHSNSQSRKQRDLEVAEIAHQRNIPLFLPNRPSEIIDDLRSLNADIAVLAAYGRIISQAVIDIFPGGIVNIHPSLLPKYRGPTPIESAILNADSETGVSIMQLTAGMDEGPVFAQTRIALDGTEGKFALYEKIVATSTKLFFDTFAAIVDGSLKATPQSAEAISYSSLIQKSDGVINWNKTSQEIEREIRTYQGWPQSRTKVGTIEVIITSAKAIWPVENTVPGKIEVIYDEDVKALLIGTANGNIEVDSIKPLGKKEMPISAFLSGYRSQLGI